MYGDVQPTLVILCIFMSDYVSVLDLPIRIGTATVENEGQSLNSSCMATEKFRSTSVVLLVPQLSSVFSIYLMGSSLRTSDPYTVASDHSPGIIPLHIHRSDSLILSEDHSQEGFCC